MSYWGAEPDENDRGSGSISMAALWLKKQLEAASTAAVSKGAAEQAILANLVLLRLLGQDYPKELSVHVGRRTFDTAKAAFYEWYEKCSRRIPAKHREGVLQSAEAEFQRWEERIFAE